MSMTLSNSSPTLLTHAHDLHDSELGLISLHRTPLRTQRHDFVQHHQHDVGTVENSSVPLSHSEFVPCDGSSNGVYQRGAYSIPHHVEDLTSDIDISLQVKEIGGFSDIYEGVWACTIGPHGGNVVYVKVGIKLLRLFNAHGQIGFERLRKRLNREVNVWKRLHHPNIAQFYGVSFQLAGRPALVMQWYNNGAAAQYISKNQDVDKLVLIMDIAKGLEYLHTLKPPVVHGDLKASNVLITDSGHAVLTDFGLSKVVEAFPKSTGNTTSSICGSPRWQAPEFFPALSADELDTVSLAPTLKSDVWSFACTAYELLTGNIPYHYAPHYLIFQLITRGTTPVTPTDRVLHDTPAVLGLLNKCWRRNSAERPCMKEIVYRWIELLPVAGA